MVFKYTHDHMMVYARGGYLVNMVTRAIENEHKTKIGESCVCESGERKRGNDKILIITQQSGTFTHYSQ